MRVVFTRALPFHAIGSALSLAFVVARAESGSGDQVAGSGKAAHVDADRGHDHLGREGADDGDAVEHFDSGAKGRYVRAHLLFDAGQSRVRRSGPGAV